MLLLNLSPVGTQLTGTGKAPSLRRGIIWVGYSLARPQPPPALPCVPEGYIRLLAVCCSLYTRVPPSVAEIVLTAPASRAAYARASQNGWPRSAARHPTPGGLLAASRAHCQPPGVGLGLPPMAFTTPRMHSPRDCGTIAFEIPIRQHNRKVRSHAFTTFVLHQLSAPR